MGDIIAYSAIVTKVKAMSVSLLTDTDYDKMSLMNSVNEVIEYLSMLPSYSRILSHADIASLHRSDIEKLLLINKYYDFSKIYRFANKHQRQLLRIVFYKYETELIKRCISDCIEASPSSIDDAHIRDFFQKHDRIDFDSLFDARNISEIIDALSGSKYHDVLYKISQKPDGGTLFDYGMALDVMFFKELWKLSKTIKSKNERDALTRSIGTKIDILNVQWILRSKKYYALSPNLIRSILIPCYYHLHEHDIDILVNAASEQELYNHLKNTYYGKTESDILSTDIPNLEEMYTNALNKAFAVSARNDAYSFATINTYLYKKDVEIHRIITTIEKVRYKISLDSIHGKAAL